MEHSDQLRQASRPWEAGGRHAEHTQSANEKVNESDGVEEIEAHNGRYSPRQEEEIANGEVVNGAWGLWKSTLSVKPSP